MTEELFENPQNVKAVTMTDAIVVRQRFEQGEMYWFAPEEEGMNGTIFALFCDLAEQWWRGEDVWDGVFEPDVEPPSGLITPGGGFGYAWFMQDFEDALGFATSGEEVMSGHYAAWQDGWELFIGALVLQLRGSDEWVRSAPSPDPLPEPEPEPEPEPPDFYWTSHWIWLDELAMPLNLDHVVWVGVDRLRIGPHDIVLSLPERTASALRAYIKARCVAII